MDIGGKAGSSRRLLQCKPFPLSFKSTCRHDVQVAVQAVLANQVADGYCLNGVTLPSDTCMRWIDVPSGKTVDALTIAEQTASFYAFGFDSGNNRLEWGGPDEGSDVRYFNTTSGAPCLGKDSGAQECKVFEEVSHLGMEWAATGRCSQRIPPDVPFACPFLCRYGTAQKTPALRSMCKLSTATATQRETARLACPSPALARLVCGWQRE